MKTILLNQTLKNLIVIVLLTFSFSSPAQSTPTDFNAGAAIIDMGITPQTSNNALKPYGLVHALVGEGIPVHWIIKDSKSFEEIDIVISGTLTKSATSKQTKNLKAGPFLISAEHMTDAESIIQNWIDNNSNGGNDALTVYWNLDAIVNAPVSGIITSFPATVIYPKNGDITSTKDTDIETGFFNPAGILKSSGAFRKGTPSDINACDQFYVLSHHTDPEKNWSQNDVNLIYDFVTTGRNVWMGCHDVSISENLKTDGKPHNKLNFLSNDGLLPYKDTSNGSNSDIYTFEGPTHANTFNNSNIVYEEAAASDPIMQFVGEIHEAFNGNSEKVFLPRQQGWRDSSTIGFYDPSHSDVNDLSPGKAGILVYGKAYGNASYGTILYNGSHISKANEGNTAQWIGEARTFGNFLLQSALELGTTFNEDLPQDMVVECDNIPAAAILTANGGCGTTATVTYNEEQLKTDCDSQYILTRTWVATDTLGNTTTHTQTVTVQDTTAPTFNEELPADITAQCDNVPEPAVLTASDNCDTTIKVSFDEKTLDSNCDYNYILYRTWTASDCAGNSISHTQTITVQDTTAPTFNEELPADITAQCDNVPEPMVLTATDNCDPNPAVTYSEVFREGVCPNTYSIIRIWTVTDACSNTTLHNQTVTVQDTTAPTFNEELPADITAQCDNVPEEQTLTAADNCGDATVAFNETTTDGDCPGNYTINRTWTATDACGNTTTHNQTVTVQDTTAPTFNEELPADITAQCDNVPEEQTLTAADNCGDATVAFNETTTDGDCPGNYTINRTWTATDACGNTTTHNQTVTVQDTTAPTFNEELPADITAQCDNVPEEQTLTAADNCGDATVAFNETTTDGDCPGNYTINRTWTATDACGNTTTHNQTVTVQDTTAPTFNEELPADITAQCDNVPEEQTLTAADNCGDATVAFNETTTDGDCPGNYTINRTWTATDACGNTTTHNQTVTVQDTTAPTFNEELPADITAQCDNVPEEQTLTAADNCGDATVAFNETTTDGDCPGNYTINRTWTATDACGNTTTHNQTVTVQDTTAPTFNEELPADITAQCDNVPEEQTLTAADNCGDATVAFNETTTDGDCPGNYTINRTWTATDACGNTTTHNQTVTVQDTTAPTFNEELPADITAQCDNVPEEQTLTAADNCGDATVAFNETTTDGDCPGNYTINRTWTATDACGNTTTHNQTVTVQDTTAPTFNEELPADITAQCDNVPEEQTLTAADNCGDATVAFNETTTDGDCPGNYTINRTWTATDACGNTTTHNQTVTVQDTTAPTFNEELPADITAQCDNVPEEQTLTAADNCGDATVAFNETTTDGDCPGNYTINRTWTATDACGNTTTHNQTVTVQDTTAPTFNEELPADITAQCDNVPEEQTLTAADNCGDATVAFNETTTDGDCPGNYTINRTWTATDACGNTTTHNQTVTVQDTTAPTFNEELPADITAQCDNVPEEQTLTAADNCGDATVAFNETTTDGDCPGNYTINRTWTATDACGNTTTHNQTVTVQDTTAPTFNEELPADITAQCDNVPEEQTLTAADNCGDATVAFNETTTDGDCPGNYTINRTWTATDACGNTTTHNQTVTVQDTTAPTFNEELPADITAQCDNVPEEQTLTAADNCGDATVAFNETTTDGDCPGNYTINRTWTATDACGNTTTHNQTVTVQDTTAPTFNEELPADITAQCDNVPEEQTLTAADNCGDATVAFNETTTDGDCPGNYTINRTWTATDACGNTTTHNQTVTVQDTTAPTFNEELPADITAQCDNVPEEQTLTAADNCGDATVAFNETTTDGDCPGNYTINRTWTATDACGNTTTHNQTVTVQDTTAPTFNEELPADITAQCDNVPEEQTLTAADNCGDATVAFNETTTDGDCPGNYTINRTWTATDACGNTTTHNQTVTVQDTTAPTFNEELPADITAQCDNVPEEQTLTAADNCGDATVAFNETTTDGDCPGNYTINRTWTATDACGNTTTHNQTVTVQDTTAPTFNEELPADITAQCDNVPEEQTLTAADNCGDATVAFNETTTDGDCPGNYTINRTWTATDACGNTTTHNQTVTVQDTTAPTFNGTLPFYIKAECDDIPEPTILTASDNCGDATVTFSETTSERSCPVLYEITRTWTATDSCGNTTTHTQRVDVEDLTPPIVTTVYDSEISVSCAEIPEVPQLEFEDACSSEINIEFEETSTNNGTTADYNITRFWIVTDECGNTEVFSQIIFVTVDGTTGGTTDLCIEENFEFDLFSLLSGDYDLDGTWEVTSNNATISGSSFNPSSLLDSNGNYTFEQVQDTYTFAYTSTSNCPTSTEVSITLNDLCRALPCGDEEGVEISKAVTANGDQWNEYFTVTGIEGCGFTTEVEIYNRWGALVYKSVDYQNDWNAFSHDKSIGGSDKVPTGTYYYIVKLKDSGLKPFAGPIYVATK